MTVEISKKDAEKLEGLTLTVDELEETEEKNAVSLIVEDLGVEENNVYILDIHFENANGEETKVNANMVVTVPVPEGWDPANVAVYYVNPETGELVDMKAVVSEDGKTATFTTNHFSYYALVQKTTTDQKEPIEGDNSDNSITQSGDNTNLSLWFALLMLAGTGLAGTELYRKKEKYQK